MSEKAAEKANQKEKTAQKENKNGKDNKKEVVSSREEVKRVKVVWTLERCKKYARRFTTEVLWASGASASYKSAVAHGWREECLAELGKNAAATKPMTHRKAA